MMLLIFIKIKDFIDPIDNLAKLSINYTGKGIGFIYLSLLEVLMIKIFIAKHPEEAHFVRGLLQGEGIAAKVGGDGSLAQVWLLQDPQLPLALEALARYSCEEDACLEWV